ncbi:unnamed protein product [Cuscuta campestris]|uniref:Uncharacterized protein n=1 Tax=Cuscuta campestris TaxID=132261 RepID=A0A484LYW8_9ASTE|nr:unnamed protein product [Cuscuta campestris]
MAAITSTLLFFITSHLPISSLNLGVMLSTIKSIISPFNRELCLSVSESRAFRIKHYFPTVLQLVSSKFKFRDLKVDSLRD